MISLLGQRGFPGPRGESGVSVVKAPLYPTKQGGICQGASAQTLSNWTTASSKEGNYPLRSVKQTMVVVVGVAGGLYCSLCACMLVFMFGPLLAIYQTTHSVTLISHACGISVMLPEK